MRSTSATLRFSEAAFYRMIGRNETAHFIHNLPLLMCGAFEWLRSRTGGSDYARGEARQEQSVRTGVVESVREVRLEGT
jgi:outer membrane lipoprotein SlyB